MASLIVACSSGADDTAGEDEGATVIEPSGTDAPGKLTVVAPNVALEATTFSVDTTPATARPLGQIVDGLAVGKHYVAINTQGPTYSVATSVAAAIEAGKATTVTAAILDVDARPASRTLGLGNDTFGAKIALLAAGRSAGTILPAADGSKGAAVAPGAYEVNFGLSHVDGVAVVAESGGAKNVQLSGTEGRRIARVQAPSRDMATASCGNGSADAYAISLNNSAPPAAVTLAPGETVDFGTSPTFDLTHYYLQASAWRSRVEIPLGQRGAGPQITKLGRIDIDDVLINSTQPRVKGTYQVYAANPDGSMKGGALLSCSPPTKTGVDLVPGKYRVEVSYSTVEAGTKVDVHVVDVN